MPNAESLSEVCHPPVKDLLVVVSMQSFCLPARSTLQYVRELAKEYDFKLTEVNHDRDISPELAGKVLPRISVYGKNKEEKLGESLFGARTKKAVTAYLREHGVIQDQAHG